MSTFEVKIRKITHLENHPNADRLEVVVIGGFRAVVAKGVHSLGDTILYIPEDSVFTDIEVAKTLQIDSYLTGKQKNRVKAVKLRGLVSQGIVLPYQVFKQFLELQEKAVFYSKWKEFILAEGNQQKFREASLAIIDDELIYKDRYQPIAVDGVVSKVTTRDWADVLKIEKYEEPIPIEMSGQVRRWPSFLNKYDLENIKRPESMGLLVAGEPVVMTEKLHGTNMTIAIGEGLEEGEEVFVCSRNNALKESESNVYWRAARQKDEHGGSLVDKIKWWHQWVIDTRKLSGGEKFNIYTGEKLNDLLENEMYKDKLPNVSFHGEVIGVQDLKYGMNGGNIQFYLFDIMVDGVFIDHADLVHLARKGSINMVPLLYYGPYDYEALVTAASGKTTLGADHIREGGVVRPIKERVTAHGDRVVLKVISDDYLMRKNGTELH